MTTMPLAERTRVLYEIEVRPNHREVVLDSLSGTLGEDGAMGHLLFGVQPSREIGHILRNGAPLSNSGALRLYTVKDLADTMEQEPAKEDTFWRSLENANEPWVTVHSASYFRELGSGFYEFGHPDKAEQALAGLFIVKRIGF